MLAVAFGAVVGAGCNRQERGNADATEKSRAATPAEGGGTSTAGSAGASKNFGDTRKKTEAEGMTSSASPTGMSKDVVRGQEPSYAAPPPTAPTSPPPAK